MIKWEGVKGTFNKDMTNDELTFEAHERIAKPLSQTCTHIWRAHACGGVCLYTRLPLSGGETARKNKKSEKCARRRMESGFT